MTVSLVKQYRIRLSFELFTYMTYGYKINWGDLDFMHRASAHLVLKCFKKSKLVSAKVLALSAEVDSFLYKDNKTKLAPYNYCKTFNVVLCNILLKLGCFSLVPLKHNTLYKFPIDFMALQVKHYKTGFTFHEDYSLVKSDLVYRFNVCIDVESTSKFKTVLDYIYLIPILIGRQGIYVRNMYFSYESL